MMFGIALLRRASMPPFDIADVRDEAARRRFSITMIDLHSSFPFASWLEAATGLSDFGQAMRATAVNGAQDDLLNRLSTKRRLLE